MSASDTRLEHTLKFENSLFGYTASSSLITQGSHNSNDAAATHKRTQCTFASFASNIIQKQLIFVFNNLTRPHQTSKLTCSRMMFKSQCKSREFVVFDLFKNWTWGFANFFDNYFLLVDLSLMVRSTRSKIKDGSSNIE